MAVTLTIAVGSVLLVICGFTWVARREEVAEVQRLLALTVRPIDDVTPGKLCAVRGRVAGPQKVQDPVTDEPVVHFETRVVRADRGGQLWAQSLGDTVRLDDGSEDSAIAELVGAELGVPTDELERTDREPSARMRTLLAAASVEVPEPHASARYALEHRAIRVGDELTLVGVAKRGEDGRVHFTSKHPLFLTPDPLEALQDRQRSDLSAMDRMLQIGLALGIACLLAAVVLGGVLG